MTRLTLIRMTLTREEIDALRPGALLHDPDLGMLVVIGNHPEDLHLIEVEDDKNPYFNFRTGETWLPKPPHPCGCKLTRIA